MQSSWQVLHYVRHCIMPDSMLLCLLFIQFFIYLPENTILFFLVIVVKQLVLIFSAIRHAQNSG